MKNKFKVKIQRIQPGQFENADHQYWIVSIRGAVGIFGTGRSTLYRVGDKITEDDLSALFTNNRNDITVTI